MRIFVACWFFPPSVSSEGIVTYKLLRNSKHSYDVCLSLSQQWSYRQTMPLEASNITPLTVDTDDLNEWVDECVRLFEERHAVEPYDAVMTRSMPPESIEVGKRIHEAHPDIPWIASIADPIAKSPYDIKAWVLEAEDMTEQTKSDLIYALKYGIDGWRDNERPEIQKLCEFKDREDYAIKNANALIFPHEALRNYVLGSRKRRNAFVVHHSFDKTMYPEPAPKSESDRVTLTFTGHSDFVRTLEPFIRALQRVKTIDEDALGKLDVRFIGHVNEEARALVYNYDLYNCISIIPNVGYLETLKVMQESDWLIHVDADFGFLKEEGGSVYFAGKIADYMGTDRPVLAITGKHSPAYGIITQAGGLCFEAADVAGMAEALVRIANGSQKCEIDRGYRDRYDAVNVAMRYDDWVEELAVTDKRPFERQSWPTVPHMGECTQKFLSICVPAYNVSCYLDRCLHSLVSCPEADQLEIIVVDDGSPDDSAQIALAYQEHYPSIIKVIRKENGGHGSTINAALAVANGIYFRVIDGDDWVDSANLATLIRNLRNVDELPDLVSTNYQQVFMESGEMVVWMKVSGDLKDYVVYDFATTDMTTEYFTMASMMAKTEILRALGFKIQEHTYYVDVEYLLFAIPYIETVMFTPEYVYRYAVGNADQSINPNVFTSRYDHHDRVIRRMVAYYADRIDMMGKGQRNYMKSLFVRHLLNSHYLLSLVWDPNKTRGYERAKDFDDFLKETAPDLYEEYGRTHPVIIGMRGANFSTALKRPRRLEPPTPGDALRKASHVIARNPLGYKIVHNDMLRNIAMKFVR